MDVFQIINTLPRGRAVKVRDEEIFKEVRRDLFGLDTGNAITVEEVAAWIKNQEKKFEVRGKKILRITPDKNGKYFTITKVM